jgi:outer membrane protein OmpA-like peptidoglycan-associated protein
VSFPDASLPPVATDHDGRFISYELEPGEIELTLSHPDYGSRACGTSISKTPSGEVEIACRMAPLPMAGSLRANVRDAYGAPLAGVQLQLSGPSTQTVTSDPAGTAQATDLAPGEYTARVASDAYLARLTRFMVEPRRATRLDLALVPRPKKSGVVRNANELRAAKLRFEANSAELGPEAALAVAEVADLLLTEPALRVRIQADGGESLALGRALAIKQRLVDAGVPDGRVEVAPEPGKAVTLTVLP